MPALDFSSGVAVDTATNIPTEIQIPPVDFIGSDTAKRTLVTMFPRKTRFIDEYSGKIFRVVQVREALDGLSATLTLDREVSREELDIDETLFPDDDPFCNGVAPGACSIQYWPCREFGGCVRPPLPGEPIDALDPPDRIRTVWVYPPPTVDRENENEYPVFSGSPPVVQIDVRTLTIYPNG